VHRASKSRKPAEQPDFSDEHSIAIDSRHFRVLTLERARPLRLVDFKSDKVSCRYYLNVRSMSFPLLLSLLLAAALAAQHARLDPSVSIEPRSGSVRPTCYQRGSEEATLLILRTQHK